MPPKRGSYNAVQQPLLCAVAHASQTRDDSAARLHSDDVFVELIHASRPPVVAHGSSRLVFALSHFFRPRHCSSGSGVSLKLDTTSTYCRPDSYTKSRPKSPAMIAYNPHEYLMSDETGAFGVVSCLTSKNSIGTYPIRSMRRFAATDASPNAAVDRRVGWEEEVDICPAAPHFIYAAAARA